MQFRAKNLPGQVPICLGRTLVIVPYVRRVSYAVAMEGMEYIKIK